MQSEDLEAKGKGEGLGCMSQGVTAPAGSLWLGEGCRIVPFPRNHNGTATNPHGCHTKGSLLQPLPNANTGTCGTFCPLGDAIAITNAQNCSSEPPVASP